MDMFFETMKIFAMYARVVLDRNTWLDAFRKKYHDAYDPHIALIQPRIISEEQVSDIKKRVSSFFSDFHIPNHRIDVIFDTLIPEETKTEKNCVMIGPKQNFLLLDLQKRLRAILVEYLNFFEEKTKTYEENFRPHITIGIDLSSDDYMVALNELGNEYLFKGSVSEIVLTVVKEHTIEEAKNVENMTVFYL